MRGDDHIYDNVALPAQMTSRMPLGHREQCAVLPDVDYVSKDIRGEKMYTMELAGKRM